MDHDEQESPHHVKISICLKTMNGDLKHTKKVKRVRAVKTESVRAAAIKTVSGSWKIQIDAII